MKQRNFRIAAIILTLMTFVILVSPATAMATKLKISKAKLTLVKGQSYSLTVKNAGTAKITWKTSSKKIATVSKKGIVKPVKKGKTIITATVGKKKLTCIVTVETPKLSKTALKLKVGKSAALTLKGNTQKLTWKTSSKKIATVTKKGKVTAKKAGKATITATTASGKVFKCKVTVTKAASTGTGNDGETKLAEEKPTDPTKEDETTKAEETPEPVDWKKGIPAESSFYIKNTKLLEKGEVLDMGALLDNLGTCYTYTLDAAGNKSYSKTTPSTLGISKLEWESGDKSIATVDSKGRIKGAGPGTTTVAAYAMEKQKAKWECEVYVGYDYKVHLLTKRDVYYTSLPIFIYIETENPNADEIGNEGSKHASTVARYADIKYDSSVDPTKLTALTKVRGGYICAIKFEDQGHKTWSIEEASGYKPSPSILWSSCPHRSVPGTSLEFDVRDYDTAYAAWRKSVEKQIWKDSMTDLEKLRALKTYLEENFRYLHLPKSGSMVTAQDSMSPIWERKRGDCGAFVAIIVNAAKDLGYSGRGVGLNGTAHVYAGVTIDGQEYYFDPYITDTPDCYEWDMLFE